MPLLVRDRLYIGNIGDAATVLRRPISGDGNGVEFTHVLSLLSSASISFFTDWRSDVVIHSKEVEKVFVRPGGKLLYAVERAGPELGVLRMATTLRDTEDEALLDYLEACLNFIDEGLRGGGAVLVHCFAGVSRSAAVITAYLMRTERKSVEEALESLRKSHENASPNDGFLEQLSLFEEMNFKIDTTSSIYKRFRLRVLGHSYQHGVKIDISTFGADPGLPSSESSEDVPIENQNRVAYRCKNCQRVVASQDNVISHVPGEAETAGFGWGGRKQNGFSSCRSQESRCSSIFVEPLKWMTSVEDGGLEGKMLCINCHARLGSFNWSGIQCSCGSWITPAFQIQKNRIDSRTT